MSTRARLSDFLFVLVITLSLSTGKNVWAQRIQQSNGSGSIAEDSPSEARLNGSKPLSSATLPLNFEQNLGQTDKAVRFLTRTHGYSVFLTDHEAVFAFKNRQAKKSENEAKPETSYFKLQFVGSHPKTRLTGEEGLSGRTNYLIGNNSTDWLTNIPNYGRVRYGNLYSGINAVFYGDQHKLEYDFEVLPGARLSQIVLELVDTKDTRLNDKGDLLFRCGNRDFTMQKPQFYQVNASGQHETRRGNWTIDTHHRLRFDVKDYDQSRALIIDPQLNFGLGSFPFATYLGGSSLDEGNAIAVDSAGSIYVTGDTSSQDFPATTNAFQPIAPTSVGNAFVAKYSSTGSLTYATYLGGATDVQFPQASVVSIGYGIAANGKGNAFILGYTTAHGSFPASGTGCGSPVTQTNCSDVFLMQLNPAGDGQIYSEFIPGSSGYAIALDSNDSAYITGSTGDNVPVNSSLQPNFGGGDSDAFVAKVDLAGALKWWTYLGGNAHDLGRGVALDGTGNVYVTGFTSINNQTTGDNTFPTKNALQPTFGGTSDAFIAEINNSGSALIYSTFLGGSNDDYGAGIAVDQNGNAYVAGNTLSSDFPLVNPLEPKFGGGSVSGDAFISKIGPAGAGLVYSTYLGGSGEDAGRGITVDTQGNAYIVGSIGSAPVQDPLNPFGLSTIGSIDSNLLNLGPNSIQPQCGDSEGCADAFVAAISTAGDQFLYFTYLGGNGLDDAYGIALDNSTGCSQGVSLSTSFASPCAYVTGRTASSDFPVSDQTSFAGVFDAFVAQVPSLSLPVCNKSLKQVGLTETVTVTCTQNFSGGQGNINWGDNTEFSTISLTLLNTPTSPPPHTYSQSGTYTLSASMTNTAGTGTAYATPFPVMQLGPVFVGVSAPTSTINAPSTLQFTASVQNASDTSVTWRVNNVQGGNASVGSINEQSGVYTPPSGLTNPITVGITAIANADNKTSSTPFQLIVNPPVFVTVTPDAPSVQAGGAPITVTATVPSYASTPNVSWNLTGSACSGKPCGSINTQGPSTATTYSPPAVLPGSSSIVDTLVATSVADTTQSGHSTITVTPGVVSVSIKPKSATVIVGESSPIQFSATVNGSSNTAVAWTLSGTGCSNAPCGSLSSSGLYTAPVSLISQSPQTDTVTATAQADTSKSDSAQVTVTVPTLVANPVPLIDEPLVPTSNVPGGPGFTLTVNGAGFVGGSVVEWNGTALSTHFTSSTQLTATVPVSDVFDPGTASIAVENPLPGGGTSNTVFYPVAPTRSQVGFTRSDYQGGAGVAGVTVADLKNDGDQDLIVANESADTISVFVGDGHGTFAAKVDYATGASPLNAVVGDFNGDGILDIAVSNLNCALNSSSCGSVKGSVSILMGNRDGTFQSHVDYASGDTWTTSVLVGDFNGDGKLDLIAVNGTCPGAPCSAGSSSISVLLGNGDGTFLSPVNYTVGLRPTSGVVGDFNGDGKLDIAVTNSFANELSVGNTFSVLLGNGDGTFQTQKISTAAKNGKTPIGMVTADFNNDGILDLAIANEGEVTAQSDTSSVSILLGNGDGTFKPALEYAAGIAPQRLAVGDYNGDGVLDLVVTNSDSSSISLYLGNGDGTFQPNVMYAATGQPYGIASADFNHDGQLDVAITEESSGDGSGIGSIGTFIAAPAKTTPTVAVTPSSLTITTAEFLSVGVLVSGGTGKPTPTGAVTLTSGSYSSAATTLSNGSATISIPASSLAIGTDILTVTYTPDSPSSSTYNTAIGTASVTVNNPVTVTISPNGTFSIETGQSQDFISNVPVVWTVTGTGCDGGPCGTISQAGHYVAPATLSSSQTDTVVATAQVDPTRSATAQVTIFLPSTAPTPPPVTVPPGQPAQYSVTLAPGTGDPLHPLALSCSNLPNGSSCQFSQNPLPLGTMTFSVTITTTGTNVSSLGQDLRGSVIFAAATPLLGIFLLGFSRRGSRKRLLRLIPLVILCILIPCVSACGTGGSFGKNQLPSPSSTPEGVYTVFVFGQPQVPSGQVQPAAFQVTSLPLTVN